MKNIFLLFLSLVLSSIAYAGAPQLPDDVLSGLTYTEANITKEFPDYMMNVVDKSDGHPVRLGDKSIRFEVRSGDCFDWAIGGFSDCTRYPLIDFQGDRERYELATDVFKKKEHWFAWSIYFPEDYKNNWPLKNMYGQFHEKDGGNVIWSFEQYPNGIVLTKEKGLGDTEMKQFTVLGNNELPGKWHDFLIHAKFSKNDDGFLKVWVNDKLMADYRGITESTGKVFHKFGIYRTGITRFHNQNNLEGLNKCIKENEGLSWAETAVRAFSNNWEVNFNWSKVLYEKCNSYYDEIEIPTDIVYYDEVRRADSCEGLGLLHDCANLAILNQKQLMLVDKIKSQANKKILAKVGKKNKKEVKGWVDTRVNIWTEEPNFFQQLGSSKSRKEALNSFIAEGIQKFK